MFSDVTSITFQTRSFKLILCSKARKAQDDLRPFPWTRRSGHLQVDPIGPITGAQERDAHCMDPMSPDPSTCSIETSTPSGMTSLSASPSRSIDSSCDSLAFLDYKLPPADCSEGRVIQHAKQVMSNLFKKHDPMIFKFGYTHNPTWRWTNRLYGYVLDKHKYTNMVVIYQSAECRGPAMLEACLIDIYRSFLVRL